MTQLQHCNKTIVCLTLWFQFIKYELCSFLSINTEVYIHTNISVINSSDFHLLPILMSFLDREAAKAARNIPLN